MLQDSVKQGRHIGSPLRTRFALDQGGPTVDARGINHGEIQLLVVCAQLVKQLKCGIDDSVGTRARFVHLIHHHDGLQTQSQGFFGDKAGLWHGAFLCVNQKHHAVDHRQSAFNLATKVRVARGVDDVDVGALPADSAVFGEDGDAAFSFNRVVVHHGVHYFFVFGKRA